MFSTRNFVVPVKDIMVSGTILRLYDKHPIRITFLNFTFLIGKTRYFVDIKYVCPLCDLIKFVKVELSRDRFLSLNEGDEIVVKFKIYVEFVYGIKSPQFSIPIGIE